jgi:hypothetical protein
MSEVLLQPLDLLVALPADGTARQQMGHHLGLQDLGLQVAGQPLRHDLERQMGVFQVSLLHERDVQGFSS